MTVGAHVIRTEYFDHDIRGFGKDVKSKYPSNNEPASNICDLVIIIIIIIIIIIVLKCFRNKSLCSSHVLLWKLSK